MLSLEIQQHHSRWTEPPGPCQRYIRRRWPFNFNSIGGDSSSMLASILNWASLSVNRDWLKSGCSFDTVRWCRCLNIFLRSRLDAREVGTTIVDSATEWALLSTAERALSPARQRRVTAVECRVSCESYDQHEAKTKKDHLRQSTLHFQQEREWFLL